MKTSALYGTNPGPPAEALRTVGLSKGSRSRRFGSWTAIGPAVGPSPASTTPPQPGGLQAEAARIAGWPEETAPGAALVPLAAIAGQSRPPPNPGRWRRLKALDVFGRFPSLLEGGAPLAP